MSPELRTLPQNSSMSPELSELPELLKYYVPRTPPRTPIPERLAIFRNQILVVSPTRFSEIPIQYDSLNAQKVILGNVLPMLPFTSIHSALKPFSFNQFSPVLSCNIAIVLALPATRHKSAITVTDAIALTGDRKSVV